MTNKIYKEKNQIVIKLLIIKNKKYYIKCVLCSLY